METAIDAAQKKAMPQADPGNEKYYLISVSLYGMGAYLARLLKLADNGENQTGMSALKWSIDNLMPKDEMGQNQLRNFYKGFAQAANERQIPFDTILNLKIGTKNFLELLPGNPKIEEIKHAGSDALARGDIFYCGGFFAPRQTPGDGDGTVCDATGAIFIKALSDADKKAQMGRGLDRRKSDRRKRN